METAASLQSRAVYRNCIDEVYWSRKPQTSCPFAWLCFALSLKVSHRPVFAMAMSEAWYPQCASAVVAWLLQSLPFQSFKVNWREWVECSANRLSLSSRWKMTSTCRTPQLLWVCVCPLSVLRCEAFPYVNSFYFFPSPNNPLTNPVIHSSMHFLLITDCLWFEVNLFSQYPGFHCWCALLLWLKKKITKF